MKSNPVRHNGYTLVELIAVLTIISVILVGLIPLFKEPLKNAKIDGAIGQAYQILNICNSARVRPTSTVNVFGPSNKVTASYRTPSGGVFVNASVLNSYFTTPPKFNPVNPFGYNYQIMMSERFCTVSIELDEQLEGWRGYHVEPYYNRSRILISNSGSAGNSSPTWVQQEKRALHGEPFR